MAAFIYNDGGRAAAGFRAQASDCVARAAAIAAQVPYLDVYQMLHELASAERPRKGRNGKRRNRSNPREGVFKSTTRKLMAALGFTWVPTMTIGSGCRVHLRASELPAGRIIVQLSRHVCAVIDGVVHDTYDPSREGTRCVYGYWHLSSPGGVVAGGQGGRRNGSRADRRRNQKRDRKENERQTREEQLGRWTPFVQVHEVTQNGQPNLVPVSVTGFEQAYINNRYFVLTRRAEPAQPFGMIVHLSIRRLDRGAARDWRDFQRIKNELVGAETEAVEIFPAESRLVDESNQYHLWCFPKYRLPFGFTERSVLDATDGTLGGATQRPFDQD